MHDLAAALPPLCTTCGSSRTIRVRRKGLMQLMILHRFGLFPWECTGCRNVFMFESRGKVKRRRGSIGEVHLPRLG